MAKKKATRKTKVAKTAAKKPLKVTRVGRPTSHITSHITDEDINEIKKVVEKKEEVKLVLDAMTIKALPIKEIVALIELRNVELKQLKSELVSRLI